VPREVHKRYRADGSHLRHIGVGDLCKHFAHPPRRIHAPMQPPPDVCNVPAARPPEEERPDHHANDCGNRQHIGDVLGQ